MPIRLAPLNRRQFLSRSLTAAAGLLTAPALLAANKRTDPDAWALLSDIHLAADRQHVERGVNMTEHFLTVSRELLGLPQNPAGVFINGDCAFNNGETGDYGVVADLLTPIRGAKLPVHLALGNHDNRERFWNAFPQEKAARRPLADRQAALLRTRRVNWFILDSLEQTRSTPGLLGKSQLAWLAKTLDENSKQPAIVMVHHNPGIEGGNFGLKDTLLLMEVIRPRKQVKAYIFGHTHNWEVQQDSSGIHLVNLPAVAYVFREGEPSGWVHAKVEADGMRLELRCVDPAHKSQGEVKELTWRT